jgi:DNA-binding response OmpR family regulator
MAATDIPATPPAYQIGEPIADETDTVHPREVLLIDDDAEFRDTVRFGLESEGYSVWTCDNGPEALEALLALPPRLEPRLVLLAIDLPGLDGHTLHEELARARPNDFIVAFLCTRNSEADQVRASAAGAVDFLVKPMSIPILLAKVRVWFDRYRNS